MSHLTSTACFIIHLYCFVHYMSSLSKVTSMQVNLCKHGQTSVLMKHKALQLNITKQQKKQWPNHLLFKYPIQKFYVGANEHSHQTLSICKLSTNGKQVLKNKKFLVYLLISLQPLMPNYTTVTNKMGQLKISGGTQNQKPLLNFKEFYNAVVVYKLVQN